MENKYSTDIQNELMEAERLFQVFKDYCENLNKKYPEHPTKAGVYMQDGEMKCLIIGDTKLLKIQHELRLKNVQSGTRKI